MTKPKRRNKSAAVTPREQTRQQQQSHSNTAQGQRARSKNRKRSSSKRNSWLWVGGTIVLVVAIVGLFFFLSNQSNQSSSKTNIQSRTPVDATTFTQVTNVNAGLLSQVGTGGLPTPFKAAQSSQPLLTGPTGKPEVFFFGAEWCPNCAAERWGVVVALSRFGTFHSLMSMTSASDDSDPNTSTFTFYQSNYTSSYIDFVPLENQDQQRNDLQTPTADQQQLLTRYNVSSYPFMDIGDRYVVTAASYDPTLLRTDPQDPSSQPLSRQQIASQLSSVNMVSKKILSTANYLTAAFCSITKNQPSNVCSDPIIQHIETSLSQTGQPNTISIGSLLATIAALQTTDIRRRPVSAIFTKRYDVPNNYA
jgi:thiol-disulfide isomerase/thioredoxin